MMRQQIDEKEKNDMETNKGYVCFEGSQNGDGNTQGIPCSSITDSSLETKKKSRKKTIITLILVIICTAIGALFGRQLVRLIFNRHSTTEKTFSSGGLTITLTEDFSEDSYVSKTAAFTSKDVMVIGLREPFALMQGLEDLTVDQYAEMVLKANGRSVDELQSFNGIPGFEYDWTNEDVKQDYHYRTYTYKADDAFWTIQFIMLKKDAEEYQDKIDTWAATVRFGE